MTDSSSASKSQKVRDPEGEKLREVLVWTDEIVDACGLAMSGFRTEALHAVAEEADRRSGDKSWLAHMIRDYLETWR